MSNNATAKAGADDKKKYPLATVDAKGKRFKNREAVLVGSVAEVRSRNFHRPAVIGEFPVFVEQSGAHRMFTWNRKLSSIEE